MNDKLNLQWTGTYGTFRDAHGSACLIGKAQWTTTNHVYIKAAGSNVVVLSPEMCAELALVLGYIAITEGELPNPEGETA